MIYPHFFPLPKGVDAPQPPRWLGDVHAHACAIDYASHTFLLRDIVDSAPAKHQVRHSVFHS